MESSRHWWEVNFLPAGRLPGRARVAPLFYGITDWLGTFNIISFLPAMGRSFVWVALWCFQHLWILFGFYLSVGTAAGWFGWVWVSQILSPVHNSSGISSVPAQPGPDPASYNGHRKFSKGKREGIALEFEIGSSRQAPPKS